MKDVERLFSENPNEFQSMAGEGGLWSCGAGVLAPFSAGFAAVRTRLLAKNNKHIAVALINPVCDKNNSKSIF